MSSSLFVFCMGQIFADVQRKCLKRVYPQAKLIHVQGADRHMISKKASSVSKHLLELVSKRQTKHAMRQWGPVHMPSEHHRASCLEIIYNPSCAASSRCFWRYIKKITKKLTKCDFFLFFSTLCQMFAVICFIPFMNLFLQRKQRHQVYPED